VAGVIYEVHVVPQGDQEGRFEFDRHEPLSVGYIITRLTVIYRVLRVLPGNDDGGCYGIVEVERVGGPAVAWYGDAPDAT
jgi:hypothetical protein